MKSLLATIVAFMVCTICRWHGNVNIVAMIYFVHMEKRAKLHCYLLAWLLWEIPMRSIVSLEFQPEREWPHMSLSLLMFHWMYVSCKYRHIKHCIVYHERIGAYRETACV